MNDIKEQLEKIRNPNYQPDFMGGTISNWLSELAQDALNQIKDLERLLENERNASQDYYDEATVAWGKFREVETHNKGLRLALQGVIDQEPGSIAIASILLKGLDRIETQ